MNTYQNDSTANETSFLFIAKVSGFDVQEFHFMTDKRVYIIPNDLWRKNMRIYGIISIGSIRRLTWRLSAIAMVLVCLVGGSAAPALGETRALRVIAVQTELDLGDRTSGSTGPDYHISGGESDEIQISMLLDVYRPVRVHNRFNEMSLLRREADTEKDPTCRRIPIRRSFTV